MRRFPNGSLVAGLLACLICAASSSAYAATYQQQYRADGADHFMDVYLDAGGTHSFSVDELPWGDDHYVAYKNTGSGYTQMWSDDTWTGWYPTFSTYVCLGYTVKLVIYDSVLFQTELDKAC